MRVCTRDSGMTSISSRACNAGFNAETSYSSRLPNSEYPSPSDLQASFLLKNAQLILDARGKECRLYPQTHPSSQILKSKVHLRFRVGRL